MKYLLDTCAISELVKREPSKSFIEWIEVTNEDWLHLSVVTFGELQKGIEKLADAKKRRRLQDWVLKDLMQRFSGRIYDITIPIAAKWGSLMGQGERQGLPLPVIDALIAATAAVHDLTVVTRNTNHLERCGARVLNPW